MGHERVDSGIFDLYQDVPGVNSTANLHERDVTGNKSDTVAGTSLVAISKAIKAKTDTIPTSPVGSADMAVPGTNASANATMRDVIGDKTDTIAGNSLYAQAAKAATLAASIYTFAGCSDDSGSTNYTDVGGEQMIYEMAMTTRRVIHGVWLDLVNMTQDGTIKFYYKIDGTNYREVKSYTFAVATDSDGVFIALHFGVTNNWKVTYTEGGDEAAIRAIPYSVIYEVRE